jgi:glycerol-3-phosphate O-acyltransferase
LADGAHVHLGYAAWNTGRLLSRRWKRYGEAAVVIGEPVPLDAWFARLEREGRGLFTLPRTERLGEIQALADDAMQRVGAIIPVTPVPLDRAYELLRLRRVVSREGNGYVVLPRGRELISYYANSIAHLLGEFESAVRARDALPVHAVVDL